VVRPTVSSAARPLVFWVGEEPATQTRVRGWPVGRALLQMLGEANPDVGDALAGERAWLDQQGYPADLPLPALWWRPSADQPRSAD